MNKINHEFFGVIDTQKDLDNGLGDIFGDGISVLWEEEYKGITVTLWYDKNYEITNEILDIFSNFLKNYDLHDKNLRLALKEYLKKDNEYIVFHKDAGLKVPSDISEFVEKMQVNSIALWIKEDFINVDFMINSDESDEILCVKLNNNLEVKSIDWES